MPSKGPSVACEELGTLHGLMLGVADGSSWMGYTCKVWKYAYGIRLMLWVYIHNG